MRLPIAPQLSTKDGVSNKNARMTNALKETDDSKELVATRPGLKLSAQSTGNGKGLVAFNDRLLSVYGSTIGVKNGTVNSGMTDLGSLGGGNSSALFISFDGAVIVGTSA